ncbi:ANGL4 protein, partial [Amia calva]|nr:ANGL4 protein [Amia calva]
MKTTLAILALFIATLLEVSTGFPGFDRKGAAGKEKKVQFASWDDVNVIAHGLLQLGHGLKEHVDKTKGQLRDISVKLKTFNGTVTELSRQTQRLQEDGEALKAKAQGLEERESLVLSVSTELRQKAEEMQREGQTVQDRVSKLEEKVDGLLEDKGLMSWFLGLFQWMLEAQNRRIDDLVERIRQQQDKLDKQNIRIKTLQSQSRAASPKIRAFLGRKLEEVALNGSTEQADAPNDMAPDCHVLFLRGERTSGVYTIQPHNTEAFEVYCQMTSEGGWTVLQRRLDGSVDFDQLWQAYKTGFGSLDGEFWLGLEKIHMLSQQGNYMLQVELTDWSDQTKSIQYPFHLSGEDASYAMHLHGSSPSNQDSAMSTEPTGLPFSTRDRDHDHKPDMNCAKQLTGGWWFSNCGRANLNGKYFSSVPRDRHARKQGVFWKTWRGRYYPLKTTVMMMAPAKVEYDS